MPTMTEIRPAWFAGPIERHVSRLIASSSGEPSARSGCPARAAYAPAAATIERTTVRADLLSMMAWTLASIGNRWNVARPAESVRAPAEEVDPTDALDTDASGGGLPAGRGYDEWTDFRVPGGELEEPGEV